MKKLVILQTPITEMKLHAKLERQKQCTLKIFSGISQEDYAKGQRKKSISYHLDYDRLPV